MSETADIVIVGAGISGLATAYELSQRNGDRRILVLDRRHAGSGATSRNIGRVRTSQFGQEIARFAKNAFAKHARLSRQLGRNTLFWTPGYALVFYDQSELEIIDGVRSMLSGLGQKTEFHTGREVVRRLPVLQGGEDPVGTLIRPDASVHHDTLLNAYKHALRACNVQIREHVEVTGVDVSGGRVSGVRTAAGDIRCETVINCTGGWSRSFSEMAGVTSPNAPIRREAIVTESARPYMDTMITFYRPIEGWFHQTLRGETVIGVTDPDEPLGLNHDASAEHLMRAASLIMAKAPKVGELRVVRQWAGVYDMTPDRKPLIGPVATLPGFVQFNGDNGRGVALAPYVAELLAEWLDTGRRPELLAPFDANRFADRPDEQVVMGDYYAAYKTPAAGKAGVR